MVIQSLPICSDSQEKKPALEDWIHFYMYLKHGVVLLIKKRPQDK